MNEEIEYAEMLEIPVSTVNVVRKKQRKKTAASDTLAIKDSVIASVNDRVNTTPQEVSADSELFAEAANSEGTLDFDPVPDRIDTVRLYSTSDGDNELRPYDYPLNEEPSRTKRAVKLALGIEFGVACALCGGIFLTNVFMPNSAINTFFRSIHSSEPAAIVRPYTDFTLSPVVSELSDAKLTLSPSGILSFTDECCVYPAADGKVSEVTQTADGLYTLKINHTEDFTGVFTGLNSVYYAVGEEVKSNVPIGYSQGEAEVQVTMYSKGQLLNCFELTEENCLAWLSTEE